MSAPGRLCQAGTVVPAGEMEMKEPPTGFRNQEPSSQEEGTAGGARGRQTDWDGGGVFVCLYLCMCVCGSFSLYLTATAKGNKRFILIHVKLKE